MSAEGLAVIPQCVECGTVWLPADEARWEAYLTDTELAFTAQTRQARFGNP
jgi:hypothetical protein